MLTEHGGILMNMTGKPGQEYDIQHALPEKQA